MTDEEFAALEADVASRNEKLAAMREEKEAKVDEAEILKAQIRDMQKATDPLEIQLREENSRRNGTPMATIGLGG